MIRVFSGNVASCLLPLLFIKIFVCGSDYLVLCFVHIISHIVLRSLLSNVLHKSHLNRLLLSLLLLLQLLLLLLLLLLILLLLLFFFLLIHLPPPILLFHHHHHCHHHHHHLLLLLLMMQLISSFFPVDQLVTSTFGNLVIRGFLCRTSFS